MSSLSSYSDDSWCQPYDFVLLNLHDSVRRDFKTLIKDRILRSYEWIYREIEANPVETEVEEVPIHPYDYDEVVNKPRFFNPPLQQQRNAFVRDTMSRYTEDMEEKLTKLAVLGCGSLSLERTLLTGLGDLGVEHVVSVDIDPNEIARGLKLLNIAEHQHENIILNSNRQPVLFEVYQGDILEYDERLSGTSCVCSTEVIEHIPQEDATRYVRSVLLAIRPQLFILSTPNHDYNTAFGPPFEKFRHGDHKFEFSRQEFKYWLHNIMKDFATDYDYSVEYVGNISGFTHLSGATQFAVIRRNFSGPNMLPYISAKPYRKVGQLILKNSLFCLEREKIKKAFILWLQLNPLREKDLLKTFIGNYWRVYVKSIVDLAELPKPMKKDMNTKAIVDMLRFLCHGRIVYESDNGNPCFDIPHNMTKEELIEVMTSENS